MSRRSMRAAWVVFGLTAGALAIGGYVLYRYAVSYPDRPAARGAGQRVTLAVPQGASFPEVVTLLAQRGLIHSPAAFRFYANYKGQASKIRAGTYTLATSITPRVLLDTLVHGVPAPQVSVTIPEGKNLLEIVEILQRARVVASPEALLREMRNKHLLRRLGVPATDSIEGFLFPDTYRFKTNSPPQEILSKLYRRHHQVFYQLVAKYSLSTKARKNLPAGDPRRTQGLLHLRKRLGWGHREIVTMASIVEKETGQVSERPLIASVFLNRLLLPSFQPKLLQTDPTIIYGCTVPTVKSPACTKFEGRIRRIHLDDRDNPYNTYAHTGLPPGPIANPGRAAIEAVLAPARARYLYFVSKNDGTHQFSQTRSEHERYVDRYQRRRTSSN